MRVVDALKILAAIPIVGVILACILMQANGVFLVSATYTYIGAAVIILAGIIVECLLFKRGK